jgi:radical SAM superfamily enzyme YgiQ (UPF0313 family)
VKVVLVSTYDLGRQPFGLASPAAWLRARGHQVSLCDLAVNSLPTLEVREADLVAFHLPMHTATRLAAQAIARVQLLNDRARLCCYGLYAPLNEEYLRSLGVDVVLGPEFEADLLDLAEEHPPPTTTPELPRLSFIAPDRNGLPILSRYPKLMDGERRKVAGYTEASRGCKHLCRHCPVVPVYNGRFRVVQPDVVIEDIRRQVASGAEHISFGDPDFFNGPTHARRIIEQFGREFPGITYDVTVKIEHLLQHQTMLPLLRESGCAFVISAVESIEDQVLAKLEKGHTAEDFWTVVKLFRETGLTLSPTFLPFTPWTTLPGYASLLQTLLDLDLVWSVPPVQLALRLLIPSGSRLLDLEEVRGITSGFDAASLVHRWRHPDPRVDELASTAMRIVNEGTKSRAPRSAIFAELWSHIHGRPLPQNFDLLPRTVIPYMEEPWFC